MAKLVINNPHDVKLVLRLEEGNILNLDLVSLYFVAKYGGDEEFLNIKVPERSDPETGTILPAFEYDILIRERK